MPRRYENSKSAPSPQQDKYEQALVKLRTLQEECERLENRYICPCVSAADSAMMNEEIRKDYVRFKEGLFPNGPDHPPRPIEQANVTPNEIMFRMMVHDNIDPAIFSEPENHIKDGYIRWNPPSLSQSGTQSKAGWDKLTKRIGREIARLENRREKGYSSHATPCEVCFLKTPENKIPMTGIFGATSYLCEIARAHTPEQIEDSNANIKTSTAHMPELWALEPKKPYSPTRIYPQSYPTEPVDKK